MNLLSRQIALCVALCFTVMAAAVPARAQGPETVTRDEINDVARELYCPLCTGLSVDICEIQVCIQMRDVIGQKLTAGESKEQIKAYFVEQYGQKVLGQPEKRGVNLIAWLLPGVFLGLGLVAAASWLRRRPRTSEGVTQPTIEYHERLERELRQLDA